jgi:hypothetical protein
MDTSGNRRIDAIVDQQVQDNWRPIPGGNSREDAAILSKDIMKAQSYEELEVILKYHASQGR